MSELLTRTLGVIFLSTALGACDLTSRGETSFNSPSGATANLAKCTTAPDACYRLAAATCAGPYQVINSERHWGGLISESGHGTMWYTLTYQCGPSDGKLAQFPMRDGQSINANIHVD